MGFVVGKYYKVSEKYLRDIDNKKHLSSENIKFLTDRRRKKLISIVDDLYRTKEKDMFNICRLEFEGYKIQDIYFTAPSDKEVVCLEECKELIQEEMEI